MLEAFRQVEIIMEKRDNRWYWNICLPGLISIAEGYGNDQEDCWQKAVRAKSYIQKYGIQI